MKKGRGTARVNRAFAWMSGIFVGLFSGMMAWVESGSTQLGVVVGASIFACVMILFLFADIVRAYKSI